MSKTVKRLGRGLDSLVSNLRGNADLEVPPPPVSHPKTNPPIAGAAPSPRGTSLEKPPVTPFHVEQAKSQPGPSGSFTNLAVDILKPNPYQPRSVMDDRALSALVASIRKSGILQPITVRIRDGRHEIIAGERRWTAAKACGLATVPVIVREADDEQMLELALIENIQREELNPIDRAKAYKRFCTRFNMRAEDLADRLAEDRSTIANYMRMLDLSPSIQELIAAGRLGMGHGRCLLGMAEPRRREELAFRAVEADWSVRTLELEVRKEKSPAPLPGGSTTKNSSSKVSAHLRDLQHRFEHTLKTKVTIVEGRRKGSGRIMIEYYTLDDFDRIASALGVGVE